MSEAALNRLLAFLLLAAFGSGLLTLRSGAVDSWWLYAFHGLSGGVLLAASVVKLRRSLPRALGHRRWVRLSLAVPLAASALLSMVVGFAWVAGGRYIEVWPWTLLGWHGVFGWAVLGFGVAHLALGGRWRLLRPRQWLRPPSVAAGGAVVSRRTLVGTATLAVVGAFVWGAAELLDRAGGAPRRFTGSRWLPAGGIPIPTTFLGEGVPSIDLAGWRLRVVGAVDRPVQLTVADLTALGTVDITAVLDCTGGWAMETTWRGVSMATLLDSAGVRAGAQRVEVRSVTGWGVLLPLSEARQALLATGVAGIDLPAANGAPCRLVAPDRRGVDWVKWIDQITVS